MLPFNEKKLKFSSPKDVWLKLAMVPEKKIFKIGQCISLLRYYLPLIGEGRGPSFEQT